MADSSLSPVSSQAEPGSPDPAARIERSIPIDDLSLARLGRSSSRRGIRLTDELHMLIEFWMAVAHTYETRPFCRARVVYPLLGWPDRDIELKALTKWMNRRPSTTKKPSILEPPTRTEATKQYSVVMPRYIFDGLEEIARRHGVDVATELSVATETWARLDVTARHYPDSWLLVNSWGRHTPAPTASGDYMGWLRGYHGVRSASPKQQSQDMGGKAIS